MQNLGIELGIVNRRAVVDELARWNLDAEESAASRGVAQRMTLVGGGDEGGITLAVFGRQPNYRMKIRQTTEWKSAKLPNYMLNFCNYLL